MSFVAYITNNMARSDQSDQVLHPVCIHDESSLDCINAEDVINSQHFRNLTRRDTVRQIQVTIIIIFCTINILMKTKKASFLLKDRCFGQRM